MAGDVSDNTVTGWVLGAKAGDPEAAQRLWERYYHDLIRLARAKLRGAPQRRASESDVVVDAFDSFFRDACNGVFPNRTDRHDFWRLMMLYTARKASDQIRRERASRRGGGRERGESAFDKPKSDEAAGIMQVIGREPTPQFAVQMAETFERCLNQLPPDHRGLAVLLMEGYSNSEIAQRLGCSLSTVERRRRNIRQIWEEELSR